jgi:hybrid polyketide synthase/nonribosomal peptide synthetase ACE1
MKEIPWLSGHQLENKTVFPAAGYVATALEASKLLANAENVQLIDIESFVIHQALVFDEEDAGIETLTSLADVDRTSSDVVRARFTLAAALGKEPRSLTLIASGSVSVRLGEPTAALLPQRGPSAPHMIDVGRDQFYSSLAEAGYIYSGPFRGLSSLKRKLGRASGTVDVVSSGDAEERLLVHPATLDCALQSIILSFSYPGDGELWSLHVPSTFSRIRVNPCLCGSNWADKASVPFESTSSDRDFTGFVGDVELYDSSSNNLAIQVEGMKAVPIASTTAAADKKLFSHTIWKSDTPDCEAVAHDEDVTQYQQDLAYVIERISTFYTREFDRQFPLDDPANSGIFSHYLNWVRHINSLQDTGKHVYADKEWLSDTLEEIMTASKRYVYASLQRCIELFMC